MKKHSRISIALLLFVLFINLGKLKAQDPLFSQSFSSAQYLNPALTGFTGYTRLQAKQRIQWPGLPGNFNTTYLAADLSSKGDKFGFGVTTFYDNSGSKTLTMFSSTMNLAYRLKFNENSALRFGFGLGWNFKTLYWDKLIFGDEIDSHYGYIPSTSPRPLRTSILYGKAQAGVFFHNKYLYAGYSVFNFNEPNQSFFANTTSKLPMRHSFQLGAKVYQSDDEKLRVSLTGVLGQQQSFRSIVVGVNTIYKRIGFGLMYRDRDAYIAALSYNRDRFQVRYSYDYTISRLTNATAGSHEFSLGFILGKGRDERVNGAWIQSQF